MPKKKMKFPSVRKQLERKKKEREAKFKARAPLPMVTETDEDAETTIQPQGWNKLTKQQKAVDIRRRTKEQYRNKAKNPSNTVRVTYTFMPSELGFMGPTKEEISLMEEQNPTIAKRMRNYREIYHKVTYPHAFLRDESMTMKKQIKEEKHRVKQLLLASAQQNAQQDQIVAYNPEGPTLDLDNLTTAGDTE